MSGGERGRSEGKEWEVARRSKVERVSEERRGKRNRMKRHGQMIGFEETGGRDRTEIEIEVKGKGAEKQREEE